MSDLIKKEEKWEECEILGIRIKVKPVGEDGMWGNCSGCGLITPSLRKTKKTIQEWLKIHIDLFHTEKKYETFS